MPQKIKTELLLEVYDQAYDVRAWHGPNLLGSLKGLTVKELLWRPKPKRHNIWEITLHCAYWKYVVFRKLTGEGQKGDFPRKPSNFPKLKTDPNKTDWLEDLKLLQEYHDKLRTAIFKFPQNKLYKCPDGSPVSYVQTIYGAASHDLYHAGQIQLLKRLLRSK